MCSQVLHQELAQQREAVPARISYWDCGGMACSKPPEQIAEWDHARGEHAASAMNNGRVAGTSGGLTGPEEMQAVMLCKQAQKRRWVCYIDTGECNNVLAERKNTQDHGSLISSTPFHLRTHYNTRYVKHLLSQEYAKAQALGKAHSPHFTLFAIRIS